MENPVKIHDLVVFTPRFLVQHPNGEIILQVPGRSGISFPELGTSVKSPKNLATACKSLGQSGESLDESVCVCVFREITCKSGRWTKKTNRIHSLKLTVCPENGPKPINFQVLS